MRKANAFPVALALVILVVGWLCSYLLYRLSGHHYPAWIGALGTIIAAITWSTLNVANPWERAVVVRLGQFRTLEGPGLFAIIPVVDAIPFWIDIRVIATIFRAEKTLTQDTVPVDVDAVLFWKVMDPRKAALDVADYEAAIRWASQTALRDIIGKTALSEMLEGRDKISHALRRMIDERTESWGVNVLSVEIKDVLIPASLQDAMSMQAQAERERQARVILGESECQVSQKFEEAARTYRDNPVALHLRAMNMLYEGLKANSTIVIVPSTALDSMQLGLPAGLATFNRGNGKPSGSGQSELGVSAESSPKTP